MHGPLNVEIYLKYIKLPNWLIWSRVSTCIIPSAAVHGVEIIDHLHFQVGWELDVYTASCNIMMPEMYKLQYIG